MAKFEGQKAKCQHFLAENVHSGSFATRLLPSFLETDIEPIAHSQSQRLFSLAADLRGFEATF